MIIFADPVLDGSTVAGASIQTPAGLWADFDITANPSGFDGFAAISAQINSRIVVGVRIRKDGVTYDAAMSLASYQALVTLRRSPPREVTPSTITTGARAALDGVAQKFASCCGGSK